MAAARADDGDAHLALTMERHGGADENARAAFGLGDINGSRADSAPEQKASTVGGVMGSQPLSPSAVISGDDTALRFRGGPGGASVAGPGGSTATASSSGTSEFTHLSVWTHPIMTLRIFLEQVADWAAQGGQWLYNRATDVAKIAFIVAAISVWFVFPPASLLQLRDAILEHVAFGLYWVLLGIASSIGLGSGLHTFLLFLGPHIIRVTMQAGACDSVDFSAHIVGYFPHPQYAADAFRCATTNQHISSWDILHKVHWACFLWGFGTAVGELPPYFVARAARRSGDMLAELRSLEAEEHGQTPVTDLPLIERIKVLIHTAVQKYGFLAIFLSASIPNPLFDLAGITCGHFLIPFWTFFGATVLGKACVKATLQSYGYVVLFSPGTLDRLQSWLPSAVGGLIHKVRQSTSESMYRGCWQRPSLDDCGTCCAELFHADNAASHLTACNTGCGVPHDQSSVIGVVWNLFIILMLVWFLVSIINAVANGRHIESMSRAAVQSPTLAGPDVEAAAVPAAAAVPSSVNRPRRPTGRSE